MLLLQTSALEISVVVVLFSSMVGVVIFVSRTVQNLKSCFVSERVMEETVKRLEKSDDVLEDCLEKEIIRTGERFEELSKRMSAGFVEVKALIRNSKG